MIIIPTKLSRCTRAAVSKAPKSKREQGSVFSSPFVFWRHGGGARYMLHNFRAYPKLQLLYFKFFSKNSFARLFSHLTSIISTLCNLKWFSHIGVYKVQTTGFACPLEPSPGPAALIISRLHQSPNIDIDAI